MKEEGSSTEFEPIYETLVESPNELVNKNSISGFEDIGIFLHNQLLIIIGLHHLTSTSKY